MAGVGLASCKSGGATCGDHPGAPTTPSGPALDPQSNFLRGRGAESSVDDFDAARGVVPSRAAASLRSIESHPRELRFVSARHPARSAAAGCPPSFLVLSAHRSGSARESAPEKPFPARECTGPVLGAETPVRTLGGGLPSSAAAARGRKDGESSRECAGPCRSLGSCPKAAVSTHGAKGKSRWAPLLSVGVPVPCITSASPPRCPKKPR